MALRDGLRISLQIKTLPFGMTVAYTPHKEVTRCWL